jgi:hypothetical protein
MIPREILKKIQQIEIGMSLVVELALLNPMLAAKFST